ncbi:hypothetical protein OG563_26325 [Nocardia vinacea]|uniref:Uncharacterized protein n=1 Tax=Nocardia vinacea TaxID=96468 RepID=A0ABZ1YI91_9NOCA|nr:hypothetical protein [Nocardia vinacea]
MALKSYPVGTNGNMLAHVAWRETEWHDNVPFDATMRFITYGRGRSSVKFRMVDTVTGRQWEMFAIDLLHLLENAVVDRGIVSGRWEVVKRGSNYGLMLIEPADGGRP